MNFSKNNYCICGHLKVNHHEKMIFGVRRRGECEHWNCNCSSFTFKIED